MSDARHWSWWRLAGAWVVAVGAVVLLRWAMYAGTYRSALEDGRVVYLSGVWPRSFATLMTAAGFVVAVGVMGWFTWDWVNGRRERAARRISQTAGHRRVVM